VAPSPGRDVTAASSTDIVSENVPGTTSNAAAAKAAPDRGRDVTASSSTNIVNGSVPATTSNADAAKVAPDPGRDVTAASSTNIVSGCGLAVTANGDKIPEGWEAYKDPGTLKVYYWHPATETVTWEWPGPKLHDQTSLRSERESEVADGGRYTPQLAQEQDASLRSDSEQTLPDGWERFTDASSGCFYYHHSNTGDTQWDRPTLEDVLPPGWMKQWNLDTKCYYYADMQEQTSRIDAPGAYVHHNWQKAQNYSGKVFWNCDELSMSFFESEEASGWIRVQDHSGRIYWSHAESGTRFFEERPR